ncbi:MAG TPA: PKD domain-containing protein, partial [Dehalococcoidia bacterium]|nr:PKD domain-containing protein [Dehalococcoidia bacterium]
TACQNAVPVTIGRTNGQLIVVPERVDFDLPEHDPTAMIKVTRAPNDSYSFIFDAGGSTDPDNDIETYQWNFGDEMVAEGLTAAHTYTDNTERTVVLRVIDAQGNDDVVQVTIRPGTFTVSGHLYEQVCGRPSTRFAFQSPQFVQIDAHGTDGFQSFRADSDGRYEVEAAPGDFSVFANAALVPTQATKPFPAWEPAIHFFDLQADTPDRDFELCYDPIAPAQANIVTRNARFVSDTLTLRNGGIVRICDEDGLSRDVDGFGKAGGEDIFFIGHIEGRRVSTVPGGCISLPASNSAPTPMHLELISSGAFGVFKIIVVVLPGTGAPGLTTLTAPAQSGSNRLVVASNDGFLPGDDLLLDPDGPGEATYEMLATGSLILTAPLSRSYPAGTVIVNYSSPPPGFSDASPGATDNGGSGRDDSGTPVMDGSNFPTLGGVPVPAAPVATPSVTPVGEVSGVRQISPPSTGSGGLKKGRSTAVGGLVVLFATCVAVRLHVRLRRNA